MSGGTLCVGGSEKQIIVSMPTRRDVYFIQFMLKTAYNQFEDKIFTLFINKNNKHLILTLVLICK